MAGMANSFGATVTDRPAGMYAPISFPEMTLLDQRTRDGRMIVGEGFGVDELPRPIFMQTRQAAGHDGAVVVGRIDSVTIVDNVVMADGWLVDTDDGRLAAHLVATQVLRGNSVDLSTSDEDVRINIVETSDGGLTFQVDFLRAFLGASTLVGLPAFENAQATIPGDFSPEAVEAPEPVVVAAVSGGDAGGHAFQFSTTAERITVPPDLFADPGMTEPTPITVTVDGQVFGHVAAWGTRHLSTGVEVPRSRSNYAYFATGHVDTGDDMVPVGRLTMNADHAAAAGITWAQAVDHYANTATAWADVAVGEDAHGIWVAGLARRTADDDLIAVARNSALSGDWRWIGGGMEMIAAHSVNTPGFPIPRPHAYGNGSHSMSLTAAGIVRPREHLSVNLSPDAVEALNAFGADLRQQKDRLAQARLIAAGMLADEL